MVQLRRAAHTMADLELPPGEVLGKLDRMAANQPSGSLATCIAVRARQHLARGGPRDAELLHERGHPGTRSPPVIDTSGGSSAVALQQGLLAGEPRVPAGMEVAHRFVPVGASMVGGDWHDIVSLPGGRAALIVGDAMGHGPEAAAVMVQLRTAAHTMADLDLPPGEALGGSTGWRPACPTPRSPPASPP